MESHLAPTTPDMRASTKSQQSPRHSKDISKDISTLRTSSSIFSASPPSSSRITANTTPPDSPLDASKPTCKSLNRDLPTKERGCLPKPMIQDIPFKKVEPIGEGSWSKVSCAWTDFTKLKTSMDVRRRAIPNVYCIKRPASKMAEKIIYHEARVLTYLSKRAYMTDFVVDFYGINPKTGAISMDFIGLDLAKFSVENEAMNRNNSHEIAVASFWGIAHGLVEGLSFLHGCGVIHADIKPSNILIEATPKISSNNNQTHHGFSYKPLYCDFSAAFIPDLESEPPDSAQTWEYMSPELFKAGAKPTFASDVYSLALTLIAGLTGKSPYHHIPGISAVARQIWAREGDPLAILRAYHPKASDRLESGGFDRFIKDTTHRNPNQRITASEWRSRAQLDPSQMVDQ